MRSTSSAVWLLTVGLAAWACGCGGRNKSRPEARLDADWARYATCLIGGSLDPAERPSDRMKIALFTALEENMVAPDADRSTRWPGRCAGSLAAMSRTMLAFPQEFSEAQFAPLRVQLERIPTAPDAVPAYLADHFSDESLVDRLWSAAVKAGLPRSPAPVAGVLPPPSPATVARAEEIVSLGNTSFWPPLQSTLPDERLLFGEREKMMRCHPDGAHLDCASIGKRTLMARPLALLVSASSASSASSGGTPTSQLVWDFEPKYGLYDQDGKLAVAAPLGEGALQLDDESLIDVVVDHQHDSLVQVAPDGKTYVAQLRLPPRLSVWDQRGGFLFLTGKPDKKPEVRSIQVQMIGPKGLKPPYPLGETSGTPGGLTLCRSGKSTFAAWITDADPAHKDNLIIEAALHDGTSWSPIRKTGPVLPRLPSMPAGRWPWGSWLCHGSEASLSFVAEDRLVRVRCNREGCKDERSAALHLDTNATENMARAIDLGDTMLLAYVHKHVVPWGGDLYLLSLRIAPLASIATTVGHPLIADELRGGLAGLYYGEPFLLPDGVDTVMLFRSRESVRGVRIAPSGTITPMH